MSVRPPSYTKACLSAITVTNIYQSFTYKMAAKSTSMNKITSLSPYILAHNLAPVVERPLQGLLILATLMVTLFALLLQHSVYCDHTMITHNGKVKRAINRITDSHAYKLTSSHYTAKSTVTMG